MLTQEEQQQRAIMISGLYREAKARPYESKVYTQYSFKWSDVFKLSLALPIPFIAANIVYAIFTGLDYKTQSDIGSAGIIFIGCLMVLSMWTYFALRHFVNRLSDTVANASPIFWFTFLALAPSLLLLRSYIINDAIQDISSLSKESAIYVLASLLVSVTVVTVLVYMVERTNLDNIIKITLAVLFTSIPYVVGSILHLY